MTTPQWPLTGLTVLELGQIYNGPYCALLLAYHGAEVIKVEPPHGDVLRRMDRSPGGASYPFLMLNANKKGISLNLKHARGRELFLRLAEAGIPSAPVRTLPEVGNDPHLFERAVIREVEHPARGRVKVIGNPIKLAGETEPEPTPAPAIGQHTAEVLRERLGMSDAEIARLRAAGVL
jgi:crotonobetainyl-CoA:carnitine CoA-transferase CaiB-like acyl-CoA transferase